MALTVVGGPVVVMEVAAVPDIGRTGRITTGFVEAVVVMEGGDDFGVSEVVTDVIVA